MNKFQISNKYQIPMAPKSAQGQRYALNDSGIFSDSSRWPLVLILTALLAGILVLNYFQVQREFRAQQEMFAHPQENIGRPVDFSYTRVIAVSETLCTTIYRGLWLSIDARAFPPLANQDVVSFRGTLRADGSITVDQLHLHRGRHAKLFISLLPMVMIFILVLRQYRFDCGRLWFAKKGGTRA
jgi:hypothetical protein